MLYSLNHTDSISSFKLGPFPRAIDQKFHFLANLFILSAALKVLIISFMVCLGASLKEILTEDISET